MDARLPSEVKMSGSFMSKQRVRKPPRKRRKFSAEYKAEAVRLALSSDKSISALAKELDLTASSLQEWVQQAREAEAPQQDTPPGTGPLAADERQELEQLRRELRKTQEERDFLKKAAAYFAKSQS